MKPNDRRYTLPVLVEWCKQFAGVEAFDLDAAAEREHHVAPMYYDGDALGDDLADSWHGHTFVNPPWSDIETWVVRAKRQMHEHGIKTITMVLPGANDAVVITGNQREKWVRVAKDMWKLELVTKL